LPEGKQKKKAQEPCAASAGDDDRKKYIASVSSDFTFILSELPMKLI